jgi:hypothetical protein
MLLKHPPPPPTLPSLHGMLIQSIVYTLPMRKPSLRGAKQLRAEVRLEFTSVQLPGCILGPFSYV